MAYGKTAYNAPANTATKAAFVPNNKTAVAGTADKVSDTIRISGLYSGKENSKLIMSGVLKEAVTIPAGYVLKVFTKGGTSKNGKELPPFELVAQPITEKQ